MGISVCGRGGEGSWVSRAQADARIQILRWQKNICMAAGGGQDCDGTVSQQL